MNKHCKMLIVIIWAISLMIHCGVDPQNVNGNGSSVGTGMVVGKLYMPDGVTPASGAIVVIRYKNKTAPIFSDDPAASPGFLHTTTTDENGIFSFDTINPGLYVIEGSDDKNNIVLIDSMIIEEPVKPLNLSPDTLKPAGSITGSISLINGGNYQQIFVLAFGVDRFSQVNQDGTFLFTPFAHGNYNLKIISLDPQYGYIDIKNIVVTSGETTDIGIIELPMTQSPVPKLRMEYDSLLMELKISWSPFPSSKIKAYRLYRVTQPDSIDSYKDGLLCEITDTFFFQSYFYESTLLPYDSTINTIDYYVTVIDSSNNEGPAGDPVRIKLKSPLEVFDTIQFLFSEDRMTDLFLNADGQFTGFLLQQDNENTKFTLRTYSTDGSVIGSQIFHSPLDQSFSYFSALRVDSIGGYCLLTYNSDNDSHYIKIYLPDDTTSVSIPFYMDSSPTFQDFTTVKTKIFFISTDESTFTKAIYSFDLITRKIEIWKDFSSENIQISDLDSDKSERILIKVIDVDTRHFSLRWYNLDGTLHYTLPSPPIVDEGAFESGVGGLLDVSDSLVIFSNAICRLRPSENPVWIKNFNLTCAHFVTDTTFLIPDDSVKGKYYYVKLRY